MYIKAIVKPNSKKESIVRKDKETFIVSLREPAQDNMANKRLLVLLSIKFGVPTEDIKIINGHYHHKKLISIQEQDEHQDN